MTAIKANDKRKKWKEQQSTGSSSVAQWHLQCRWHSVASSDNMHHAMQSGEGDTSRGGGSISIAIVAAQCSEQ